MDILNKKNLTYIIIFVFIILSLVHLLNINDNGTDSFITLTEDQIISDNIKINIPSTDIVKFTGLGTSTEANNLTTILNNKLELDSNNMLQVPHIHSGKINIGFGGTPIRNTINCPEPMFISTTGDLTLETSSTGIVNITGKLRGIQTTLLGTQSFTTSSTYTSPNTGIINIGNDTLVIGNTALPIEQGNISISTSMWANQTKPSYSTINTLGRMHITGDEQLFLLNKSGVVVSKEWGGNGNLTVEGNLPVTGTISGIGGIYASTYLQMTGSGKAGQGGEITIINTDKTGPQQAYKWCMYNMNNYQDLNSIGTPGSGLSFWRYAKDNACNGNMCTQHMTLRDDGSTYFAGNIFGNATMNIKDAIYTKNIDTESITTTHLTVRTIINTYNIFAENFISTKYLFVRNNYVTSDKRLKENIKNISQNDKDKVLQLVPKTYNMIDDENKSKRYGLIAQEVEELYPELVSKDNKGMKAINYIELIPLLLEQIKELKKSVPNQNTINTNVINIGGVTLTSNDLLKLKQLINQ